MTILCKGVSFPASPVPAAPDLPVLPPAGERGDPLRHPRGRLLPALGLPLHDRASPPLICPSSCCEAPPGRQCGRQHAYSRPSLGRPNRSLLSGDHHFHLIFSHRKKDWFDHFLTIVFAVLPRPLPPKALSGLASAGKIINY